MSDKGMARRARVEASFAGVDISAPLAASLISLVYTDNEENEADNLQIQVHDREGLWLAKWLGAAVNAAAAFHLDGAPGGGAATKTYKVVAKSGLNVRAGPGTQHRKLGALAYGAQVAAHGASNGWASVTYNGENAYVSSKYISEDAPGKKGGQAGAAAPGPTASAAAGVAVRASIIRENWLGDGKDQALDCGQFSLDAASASGPPATVTLKATSLPYGTRVRQTKKSRAWESCRLSRIASEIAAAGGMACLYEAKSDPFYERAEQSRVSDIEFLAARCRDAGVSLKAANNALVLFDRPALAAARPVLEIRRGGGAYISYSLSAGEANAKYGSCRVAYNDPATGRKVEAVVYSDGYGEGGGRGQQLEVAARVGSRAEAQALAAKRLQAANKYGRLCEFTLPGDPSLVAGAAVLLSGWGMWDGKRPISQAVHSVGGGGYTTRIKAYEWGHA